MNICLVHGYLLSGTGSNTYTQNLARQFCRLGDNVYLLCQETHPERFDFVSKSLVFKKGNANYREEFSRDAAYPGKCFLFRPDLEGLILVPARGRYGKLAVKEFTRASREEIERYLNLNTKALRKVLAEHPIDVIHASHFIGSPAIASRAARPGNIPYFVTLPEGDFDFRIKDGERLHPCALEGMRNARRIFTVSEHNRKEIVNFFLRLRLDLENRIGVIPGGVDTERFTLPGKDKKDNIADLKKFLSEKSEKTRKGKGAGLKEEFRKKLARIEDGEALERLAEEIRGRYQAEFPDADLAAGLEKIDWDEEKIVLFAAGDVWPKGAQLLLAAVPLVLKKVPEAHFIFAGSGNGREALEAMVWGLAQGDKRIFYYGLSLLLSGREKDAAAGGIDFFRRLFKAEREKKYFAFAQNLKIGQKVSFTGALGQEELGLLMPCADILTAPSVFPGDCGIAAMEAIACGVWPISTLKEIEEILAAEFKEESGKTRNLEVGENIIALLAGKIAGALGNRKIQSREVKERLRKIAVERFSWPAIARRYHDEFEKGAPKIKDLTGNE